MWSVIRMWERTQPIVGLFKAGRASSGGDPDKVFNEFGALAENWRKLATGGS